MPGGVQGGEALKRSQTYTVEFAKAVFQVRDAARREACSMEIDDDREDVEETGVDWPDLQLQLTADKMAFPTNRYPWS